MSLSNYPTALLSDDEQPLSEDVARTRKHVTTACTRCRQAKAKCDGNQPCNRCAGRNVSCTFRFEEDERRRAPMRRKIQELETDGELLHDLIEHIRNAEDVSIMQVVSLIRGDAPLAEINHSLRQTSNEASSARRAMGVEVDEFRTRTGAAILQSMSTARVSQLMPYETNPVLSRGVLSVDRLTHTPVHRVPAAPWTTVTSDDNLVSHLVSLWATWDHGFPNGVVLEFFLRDMRSGKLDSAFCSPFLVNCVLASACPYSDYAEVKAQQRGKSELMTSFVQEAKKHLEENRSAASITNVQGLVLLLGIALRMNHDREGYSLVIQAASMCEELLSNRDKILDMATSRDQAQQLSYVLDLTSWGALGVTAGVMLRWQESLHVTTPVRDFPAIDAAGVELYKTQWAPYPRQGHERDSSLDEVQRQHAKLAIIAQELTHILYREVGTKEADENITMKESLIDLDTRLTAWYEGLPHDFKTTTSAPPPCVLLLRWWWSIFALHTLQALLRCDIPRNDQQSAQSNQQLRNAIIDRLLGIALDNVELVRYYQSTFDLYRMNSVVSFAFHLTLGVLLDQKLATTGDSRQYDSEIADLCLALRAQSRLSP